MIRLATIGTNFITDWLMEGILELDEIQLTAVYSRNLEKGKQFAAKYNVEKVYDNYEEMAKDPEIDAVYVASPTYMHYTHSITMINYGKHVLCEKPVCSNREELDILIKAAKEQGVVFMEAMKNVHSPGFHAMMDNLHKIGTVRRATIQYCQYSSRYDKFKKGIIENAFNPKLSNGALMDIGSYCIHFLASLFGKPEKILADSLFLENGVDGAGSVITSYGDKQAEIIYSKITDSKLPTQIQGEKGFITMRSETSRCAAYTIQIGRERAEHPSIVQNDVALYYELQDFRDIYKLDDYERCTQLLAYLRTVMEVYEAARRDAGIVFAADRNGL